MSTILVTGGAGYIGDHEADIRDSVRMREIVEAHAVEGVIHMAGLKAVGESVEQPLRYYGNNLTGTLRLLQALEGTPARNIVFSSSATVYGAAARMPIDEAAPTAPQNPYGQTKLVVERILTDLAASDPSWRVANLRYFNPWAPTRTLASARSPRGLPATSCPTCARWRPASARRCGHRPRL